MRTRKTLVKRIWERESKSVGATCLHDHIRAELDRLARQVRGKALLEPCEYNLALSDVLALLKEAKK